MFHYSILFGFLSIALSLPICSYAADHNIAQKDIKFSVPIKVIRPGDKVTFTNRDNVTHNIVSLTNGFQFDLGIVSPGTSKTVRFGEEEGVVDVECTIHPGMKMTLFLFD